MSGQDYQRIKTHIVVCERGGFFPHLRWPISRTDAESLQERIGGKYGHSQVVEVEFIWRGPPIPEGEYE